MFRNWRHTLTRRGTPSAPQGKRWPWRRRLPLYLEQLEDRILLSGQSGLPPALVMGRTLSSYFVGGVQNNQETITYTVYNEQANPETGVLLTDTLAPGVTVASASQLPDQSGQNLAWSLGTIQGFDRASITLTVNLANPLPLQLDTGAQAFATLDAGTVSNTTPAALLRSGNTSDPSLLASTPDANTTDPFIQEQAAKLNYDPQQIFDNLHNDVGYNSYTGSLRGARGTLWSSAGNAVDVASLGVALMRASGIPAQYVSGTLSQSQAQQLILSMFPASYQTVGYIPAGTQTADPANDPQLLAETESHYWFQFDAGSGMQDADPLMAGATIGHTFTTSTSTFTEVPDNLREKTEVKLTAEIYSQASAALGLSDGLSETVVLDKIFNDMDLVGHPLSFGNFVSTNTIGALVISSTTNTYTPYIVVGDDAYPDVSLHEVITGQSYQDAVTNFPLASQVVTGLFLNVTLSGPQGQAQTYVKTLYDGIGYATRQNGGPVNIPNGSNSAPSISPNEVWTMSVLPGWQDFSAAVAALPSLQAEYANLPNAASAGDSAAARSALQNVLIGQTDLSLDNLLSDSDTLTQALENETLVAAYFHRPRLAIVSADLVAGQGSQPATLSFESDLLNDSIDAIAAPAQPASVVVPFQTLRGILDNVAETEAFPQLNSTSSLSYQGEISTSTVFQAAAAQDIPLLAVSPDDLGRLSTLDVDPTATARITSALQAGRGIIIPSRDVMIGGKAINAWYEVNPQTGETTGVGEDGAHQALVDYAAINAISAQYLGASETSVASLSGAIAGNEVVATAQRALAFADPNSKADFASALNTVDFAIRIQEELAGKRFTGAAFEAFENSFNTSIEAAGDMLLKYFRGAKDPPVSPFLANEQLQPLAENARETPVGSTIPPGLLGASLRPAAVAASGNIKASWITSARTRFSVQRLSTDGASVMAADGNGVGSGAVALGAMGVTDAAISASGTYSVAGTGSLSFYGPGETSLGVSGNWDNYSATATGNVSITLTAPAGALALNGQGLPAGTYTITTNSAMLSGSGNTTSPNFAGLASITATNGTINLGPGSGNVTVGGKALDVSSGATLDGYTGSITVAVGGGNNLDNVTLNGNAANVLTVSATPNTLTTDQNTPVTFQANVNTSFADTYNLTAQAPPGWTVTIDSKGNVTATPAPGLQGGTYPIQLFAQSTTNLNLVAQTTVKVAITPTQPGITFAVQPDPLYTVPFNGAQLPTAFQATIHNNGPTADTYNLSFSNVPSGFTILNSGTSVTIPAGQMGIVGIYLQPNTSQPIPAPGTQLSFTVTATSASNPAITQSQTETFTVPNIDAVTLSSNPPSLNTTPGAPVSTTLTLTNVGNVQENVTLAATASTGLTVSSLNPVSLAVGQSITETVTLTPDASTPLNSTLAATVTATFGPSTAPVTQTVQIPVQVVVPGVQAIANASVAAVQLGNTDLANRLNDLSTALTNLVQTPASAVFKAQSLALGLQTALATVNLGTLDTTGFAKGSYTITVTVADMSGNPLPGSTGHGTLLIGSPVNATLSVSPTTVPPGNATITNTLTVNASSSGGGGASLLGQVADTSTPWAVAVQGTLAYVAASNSIDIVDVSDPTKPKVVSTFGQNDVARGGNDLERIVGNQLIVASQNSGNGYNFLIYSLANPQRPQLLSKSFFGPAFMTDLAATSSTAFVSSNVVYTFFGSVTGQGGNLTAINFSNPSQPVLANRLSDNDLASPPVSQTRESDVAVVNSQVAYVASSTSTGGSPPGQSTTAGEGRLLVVNIQDPTKVQEYRLPDGQAGGSTELDISGTTYLKAVGIEGNRALVVGVTGGIDGNYQEHGNTTLTVLDISDPLNPQIIKTVVTPNTPSAAILVQDLGNNQFAVTGTDRNGNPVLEIVDISNPSSPGFASIPVPAALNGGVTAAGGKLYVTSSSGLSIFNVNQLSSPLTQIGQVQTAPTGGSVALDLADNLAYVGGTTGIDIVDISNPTHPVDKGTFGSGQIVSGGITLVRLDNIGGTNYLLVGTTRTHNAGQYTLLVYSLANPLAPALAGSTTVPYEFLEKLVVQGTTVLTPMGGLRSDGLLFGSLESVDVSNPAAPKLADVLFNSPGSPYGSADNVIGGLFINPTTAYVGTSTQSNISNSSGVGQVLVIDASDPKKLNVLDTVNIPGMFIVRDIAIQGNRALLLGEAPVAGVRTLALAVLDVSNPLAPVQVGSTLVTDDTLPDTTFRMFDQSLGNGLFAVSPAIVNNKPALLVVDPTDPNNLMVGAVPEPAQVNEMAVANGDLYATSSAGLTVYQINALPSIPLTVSVQVPKNTGVSVVASSFNIPPTQILSGTTFDTLVWNRALAAGEADLTLTWQSTVSNLQPGEARAVTGDTSVAFVSQGTPGTVSLPPAVVSSAQVLGLTPASQTVAPAAAASYDLSLQNPTSSTVTYTLSVQGVPSSWVSIAPTVTLGANSTGHVTLKLTSDALAALSNYGFMVTATANTGFTGTVQGTLTLAGMPAVSPPDPQAHGIVASLTPSSANAGQGTSAIFTIQLTNTGSADDTFALAVSGLPAGVTARFAQTSVDVPPGASNFRDVMLTLTPAPGTAVGNDPFTVTAASATKSSVTGSAPGTLNVLATGVGVKLNPRVGAPGSTLQMTVTNTGQTSDTFDLSLAAPAALVASLGTDKATLAPGASQVVPVTTRAVNFAVPGPLSLTVIAKSEADAAVQAAASAALTIPTTTGLTAQLTPASQTLSKPGTAAFLLTVNNTGNTEDAYTATITGTNGPITASFMGLDGQPTQTIPVFRLPGLSTGAILLQTNLADLGQGTVQVQVQSLSQGGPSTAATATVMAAASKPPPPPATAGEQPITLSVASVTAIEGQTIDQQVATLTDNDPAASTFSVSIDWGDGTTSAGTVAPVSGSPGAYVVQGQHTYADEGTFRIRVTAADSGSAHDSGGSTATASGKATVEEALLPDGTRGTANQRFIAEVYHDVLGRSVDSSGLATWTGLLDAGLSRVLVVLGIENSPEYRQREVQSLYQRYLHRDADPLGVAVYTAFLADGGTVEQVATFLVRSAEYVQLHSIRDNDAFLDALYADTFHRAVDAMGRAAWDSAFAQGVSRAEVASTLFASAEYRLDLVHGFYHQVLDRELDASGRATWVGLADSGSRGELVLAAIVGEAGAEFFQKTA
jgi:uncharacterized membrane protein